MDFGAVEGRLNIPFAVFLAGVQDHVTGPCEFYLSTVETEQG